MSSDVVVILAALNVEYEAVRKRLNEPRTHWHPAGTRFETGRLGRHGRRVALGLVGKGNQRAAVLAERAIAEFAPAAVLFVGVAGALWPGVELGDVVVASQVYAYHGGTAEDDGLKARPRAWEISHQAAQVAQHLIRTGDWFAGPRPKVHFGPIAAGEVVQDSRTSEQARWVRQHYNDALAIEMEAAGVAQAGHLNRALPVVVVRGISDRADGSKAVTDGKSWQARAAAHAAAFADALAQDLVVQAGGGRRAEQERAPQPRTVAMFRNIAKGNAQVGAQLGQVNGTVTVGTGGARPIDLARELAALRELVSKAHQSAELDKATWLIRHLVGDVRHRWEKGTLTAYQEQLRTPVSVVASCLLCLIVVATAEFWILSAAVRVAPFTGGLWILLAVASAAIATVGGFRVVTERRRRVRADEAEYAAKKQAREAAYQRWMRKLSRNPTDAEMAGWLECDRRILVDEMMRHYRLRASQVIAHAFIEAPGPPAKRARLHRGPWRYSRYKMLLFLLTDDGVRQVDIDLDFEKVHSARTQRLDYRFDTVAAVRIDGAPTQRQTFELTLFSGPPIRVQVTEATGEGVREGVDDAWTLSRVALDASDLPRTLDVLEGIAAEGKEWIRRRHGRATERLTELSETVHNLIGEPHDVQPSR